MKYAAHYQVEPDLVAAVMTVESSGNPSAVSYAGAVGLMQVMPYEPGRFPDRPPASQLFDPDFNVAWGLRILTEEIEWAQGDVFKALMAYYDGRARAEAPLPRTLAYAQKVMNHYSAAQS
ncbi:MAG: transglycosylase SLT domain-containing protein [Chloroflexota bacterium]|nr:transglycosylase SLT domain-containing protein [Chloroflexota bacterium]